MCSAPSPHPPTVPPPFPPAPLLPLPSHKSLRTKKTLGVAARKNRLLPNWIRQRTGNTVRYNAKRRQWRRNKVRRAPQRSRLVPRSCAAM